VASGGSFRTIWCQHPYPTKALPIAPLLAKTRVIETLRKPTA